MNNFSVFQSILELLLSNSDSKSVRSLHWCAIFVFLRLRRAPSSQKPLIFFHDKDFLKRIKQWCFHVPHSRCVRLFSHGIISLVSLAPTIPCKLKLRSTFLAIIFSRKSSRVTLRYLTFQPIRKCLMSGCCVISDAKFNHLVKVVTAIHLRYFASIDDTCLGQQSDWGRGCKMIGSDVIALILINWYYYVENSFTSSSRVIYTYTWHFWGRNESLHFILILQNIQSMY